MLKGQGGKRQTYRTRDLHFQSNDIRPSAALNPVLTNPELWHGRFNSEFLYYGSVMFNSAGEIFHMATAAKAKLKSKTDLSEF